jgi:hypothetical protein
MRRVYADGHAVIILLYIGYHLWDIPADWQLELAQKYAYAVSSLHASYPTPTSDTATDRVALQPDPRTGQNLYSALSPPLDWSKI